MDKKRTKEFLSLFKDLQFTDILAFAQILQVPENENFEEFAIDIMEAFNRKNRRDRKELLKLAQDVAKENKFLVPKDQSSNQEG